MNRETCVSSRLTFGPALRHGASRPLRGHLRGCFATVPGETAVYTLFDLADVVDRLPADAFRRDPPHRFLILDLQRLVVFLDSAKRGSPGISSLVRHLVDGYPLQPFARFAAAERDRPYRLGFEAAIFELVPRLLMELSPGEYRVVHALTGEIVPGTLQPHPEATRLSSASSEDWEPRRASPLAGVTTDRSLRAGLHANLEETVEAAAGIVRRDDAGWNSASLASAVSSVSFYRGARNELCHGKGLSPREARAVARFEAVERFQIAYPAPGTELVRGSYEDLRDVAIDPRTLFFGRSAECPEDEGRPFDPAAYISWTWAFGPAEGSWRLVPAQEVWFNVPERMAEDRFAYATTNGCAVGASFEEASVHAVLEAIERDGFLTAWYLRRPASEIDLDSFNEEALMNLLDRFRLAFPNYEPVLFDLTTDIGVPTVGALAIRRRGRGPRLYAAAACHIDPEKACFRALKELTGFNPEMSPAKLSEIRARLTSPNAVDGPEGHFELYALDEHFTAFDYLELGRRPKIAARDIGRESPVAASGDVRLDLLLESLDRRLQAVSAGVYLKDLTHPGFTRRGLRAARAITPGLYPIWFGPRRHRFAVTDRLRQLAEKYTGRPFDRTRLQLAPHPMS